MVRSAGGDCQLSGIWMRMICIMKDWYYKYKYFQVFPCKADRKYTRFKLSSAKAKNIFDVQVSSVVILSFQSLTTTSYLMQFAPVKAARI